MSHKKNIVVFYHADCLDGFGSAYAAWKKFGDSAEYIPTKYGHEPVVAEAANKQTFFIDFCYPKEVMDEVVKSAASLVVLDHHEGLKEVVESVPVHVYDANRSGATIAWSYFHPGVPIPELLQHIEDEDLYRFNMPDTRALGVFLSANDFSFSLWDRVATDLENSEKRQKVLDTARTYVDYFNHLIELSITNAHPVLFEGHQVLLANTSPMKTLKSAVGNALAKKMPPFGLVMSVHPNGLGVSIRGDGSIDVSAIARKYGGNGHPNSAGFRIPWQTSMPFTSAEEHKNENSSD
ncbi:hypothetical protein HY415_00520 [Candidatus Kaiserbacteria bacterium]|nr:hypothetical protein [Candidatus Kaiserbacteria bacterium]